MRSTFKILFYLKRDKQKTNGLIPLYCRITVDGQEARFGMKCDVNPNYWDIKTNKATGRKSESLNVNTLIDKTKAAIYKIYREMQERDSYVTAEKIKNSFLGFEQKQQTLLELFDSHNEERKSQIGVNFSKSAHNRYVVTRNRISDFLMFKYNLNDIPVKEINRQFISDFETYMLGNYDLSPNYITSLLKKFRHIIELALNREWITKNPFKDHKLRWQQTDRGFLSQTEIELLMKNQFEDKRLEIDRDIFIFCSFTGLSYSDVKHLTNDNIQTSIDGKLWISGKRHKTDVKFNIPLLNIPKSIMEKYKGISAGNRLLPVISNESYNKSLAKIANQCGIEKKITSHLARHTFATLALTKGVSIESVSKMLGHTSIKTTQIYARITEKKIGNEMNTFAGNIKQLDIKLQTVKEITIEEVLQSLKISKIKLSDKVWETLTTKVWSKMTNSDRHFVLANADKSGQKPKTIQDFYVALMEYFLENQNLNNQNGQNGQNSQNSVQNQTDENIKFAVNF